MSFRCAVASEERADSLSGTASTVRGFLLVEQPGPWGVDALLDAPLPAGLGAALKQRGGSVGVKVLLARRPGRAIPGAGVRVFAAHPHHARPWLETALLDDIGQAADLDLAALASGTSLGLTPHADPVLAVCTHGRHDACCAERGRPVAAALAEIYPEETWEVSHVGGDRFSANLVVLPLGLYLGRLEPASAREAARLLRAGELDLEHLRGRSGLTPPLQAAELALRRHVDERRVDAVRFVSRHRDGARTDAVFDVDGRSYAVAVETVSGPDQAVLTCRAQRDNPLVRHVVREIRWVP